MCRACLVKTRQAFLLQRRCRRLSNVLAAFTPVSPCGPRRQHVGLEVFVEDLPAPAPPPPLHFLQPAPGRATAGWSPPRFHPPTKLNYLAHLLLALNTSPNELQAQLHLVGGLAAAVARSKSASHSVPCCFLLGVSATNRWEVCFGWKVFICIEKKRG